MMCVADGSCFLCLCAEYDGCILLRVAACRAKRKMSYFSGPGYSVLCQVNHMQGKGFSSVLELWGIGESTLECKTAENEDIGSHQAVFRLMLVRAQRNPDVQFQSRHFLT